MNDYLAMLDDEADEDAFWERVELRAVSVWRGASVVPESRPGTGADSALETDAAYAPRGIGNDPAKRALHTFLMRWGPKVLRILWEDR